MLHHNSVNVFFFLYHSGPHIFRPQHFAIAVVVEKGSQGTVSERTPAQRHHHLQGSGRIIYCWTGTETSEEALAVTGRG